MIVKNVMRRKTQCQFEKEVFEKRNGEYTVLGKYINSYTKILVKHSCGYEYNVRVNDLLNGSGCPECCRKKRTKTTQQFVNEVKELWKDEFVVLGKYTGGMNKILVKHSCGHEYSTTPCNLLASYGCPKCAGNIKKTQIEFVNEVKEKYGDEFTVLGTYSGAINKILVKHSCGHKYKVPPIALLSGNGCPKCSNCYRRSEEEFVNEIKDVWKDEYEILGKYINSHTKILVKHFCGYEYNATPIGLLSGRGCSKCGGNYKPTTEEFKQRIYEMYSAEYEILGEYTNSITKILVKHCCQNQYFVTPTDLLSGKGCPKCCRKQSKGEKAVEKHLKLLELDFEAEYKFDDCRNKNKLPFDFALIKDEEVISLIEFDGEQHYHPVNFGGISMERAEINLKTTQYNDLIKTNYCKENRIPLLRIKYSNLKNISKIIDEMLQQLKI